MSDPVFLAEKRADKSGDARDWSVLDCLEALVRDLKAGTLPAVDAVYVAMMRRDEKGQMRAAPMFAAGASSLELRGLLTQHLFDMCHYFRTGE